MELEQLLQTTKLVPRPVLRAEVFCIDKGLALWGVCALGGVFAVT